MAKQRDYTDFVNFAHEHTNLTYNDLFKLYRKNGGEGRRQTTQEIIRKEFGFEKGEMKGKLIGEKIHKDRILPYIFIPKVRPEPAAKKKAPAKKKVIKKKIIKKKKLVKKKRDFKKKKTESKSGKEGRPGKAKVKLPPRKRAAISFDVDDPSQVVVMDRTSNFCKSFEDKILSLYGGEESEYYVRIGVSINGDKYSHDHSFQILYPFDGRKKQTIKKTANNILNSMKNYYTALAQKYSNKQNMAADMLENIVKVKKELNTLHYMEEIDMIKLFYRNGIEVNSYELLTFE